MRVWCYKSWKVKAYISQINFPLMVRLRISPAPRQELSARNWSTKLKIYAFHLLTSTTSLKIKLFNKCTDPFPSPSFLQIHNEILCEEHGGNGDYSFDPVRGKWDFFPPTFQIRCGFQGKYPTDVVRKCLVEVAHRIDRTARGRLIRMRCPLDDPRELSFQKHFVHSVIKCLFIFLETL